MDFEEAVFVGEFGERGGDDLSEAAVKDDVVHMMVACQQHSDVGFLFEHLKEEGAVFEAFCAAGAGVSCSGG